MSRKEYNKNEIIFPEGKISAEIYFVTEGGVRLLYYVDGNEKTAFHIFTINSNG